MRTYPIMLDLRGRATVVVGGGAVGLRRATSLHRAGARVTLVTKDAARKAPPADVRVLRGAYCPEQIAGAFLVLACTDDNALNASIARDARDIGALVNVADQPEDCDFFLPAVLSDGDVVVAIGTGGASPGLAADLKRQIAAVVPQRVGRFAAALAEIRKELKSLVPDTASRAKIMKLLSSETAYEEFLAAGPPALKATLQELLKE